MVARGVAPVISRYRWEKSRMQPVREQPGSARLPRELLVAAVAAGYVCVRLDTDQLPDQAEEDACVKGLQTGV